MANLKKIENGQSQEVEFLKNNNSHYIF